jgi:hypothetical protein
VAYILGLVVVGLLFLSLHYFTELTKSQKMVVTSVVFIVILGAIAFNSYSSSQRESMLGAVLKFKQSKTITCNGVEVNNTNYTLSIGTYTFIGKRDTPNYGQMISASTCE